MTRSCFENIRVYNGVLLYHSHLSSEGAAIVWFHAGIYLGWDSGTDLTSRRVSTRLSSLKFLRSTSEEHFERLLREPHC